MGKILAVYGSPRRQGNTSHLLRQAVQGARDGGGTVEEVVLRDLKMSPCLEIYGCKITGRCVLQDDFQALYDQILQARGLMLASPIFFYTVSAHMKIFMDRCQSFWVKKYWLEGASFGVEKPGRKGLFISVGATSGKKLFDGALLTVRYFLDAVNAELWRSLLYRGLDFEGDVLQHEEFLKEAYWAGFEFARALDDEEGA